MHLCDEFIKYLGMILCFVVANSLCDSEQQFVNFAVYRKYSPHGRCHMLLSPPTEIQDAETSDSELSISQKINISLTEIL